MIKDYNMPELNNFGSRLKELRTASNMTQKDLCAKANLDQATVSKLEIRDSCNISMFTALKLAKALNISLDTLAGYTHHD